MTKEQVAEMTREEFEQFAPAIRVKLIEKFHGAIEFYTFREEAACVLRLDGETDAALSLSKSDEPEIPKEEFEQLPHSVRWNLVAKFGLLWGKDFKFGKGRRQKNTALVHRPQRQSMGPLVGGTSHRSRA